MKTTLKIENVDNRIWYTIDASGQILGRLATKVANLIRGRHKSIYAPHIDNGDFVIIINAEKIVVTGGKAKNKDYMFYTGYMGNQKHFTFRQMIEKNPEFVINHAVRGMLPKNKLSSQILKKLKVFVGPEHTHQAQNPIIISI